MKTIKYFLLVCAFFISCNVCYEITAEQESKYPTIQGTFIQDWLVGYLIIM